MCKIKRYLILFLSILILILSGCSGKHASKFDAFTEQLFLDLVSSPLDANFLVKDAEAFGFDNLVVEPLTYSKEEREEYFQILSKYQEDLQSFKYQKLDASRKLTYRVIADYLEVALSYKDFYYYETPLGSYLGYQAQLPLILSEYHFYSKKDIENYFDYLKTTEATFKNIIAFEKEKAANGFGMNDFQIEGIIKQCRDFLSEKDNFLISVFNKKIKDLSFLTLDEKNLYQTENQNLIKNRFLPAYAYLAEELESLKGKAQNKQGLAHFENGKEYYQVLFRDATGTKMSVSDAYEYLEKKFADGLSRLRMLLLRRPDLVYNLNQLDIFPDKSYQEIFDFYRANYRTDFPDIGDVNVRIENIHSSLEENSSPAMYFLSPIDAEVTEVIYVNKNLFKERPTYAFFTLAHEGLPGHLLQHTILKNSSLPKVRKLLSYSAYSEGWATYVETYVGKYLDEDPDLLLAYHLNDELTYTSLCMADIGINYFGWSLAKFKDFIDDVFSLSETEAKEMYYQLIEVATNYLEYYFGYYQVLDLKDKFLEKAEKRNFQNPDYVFHQFFLETGPAPFYILEEEIEVYLRKYRTESSVLFFNEIAKLLPNIFAEVDYEKTVFNNAAFLFFSPCCIRKDHCYDGKFA